LGVAITVSLARDLAARQRAAAARTGIEAELLARISAEPVRVGSVASLLDHVRDALHIETAALVENGQVVAVAGPPPTGRPALQLPAGEDLTLVVDGPPIFAPNLRFLHRLAVAAVRSLQAERLAAEAARVRELAEVDRLRAALLDDRTSTGGLGLGLAISRGFTEAINGTITPSETPGGGHTMTITLPVAP
jgi:two-component system sensor histidine kinase KdpD